MNIQRAYVEITNLCNLHCDFCAGHHRPLMAMRTDDFAVAAKKLRAVTQYIYLHVMGEPLLHPELGKILDTCAQLDFRVCITTNGTLLPKKLDILLACPALHKVAVSLHSFEGNHLNVPLEDYVTGCLRSCQKLAAAGVNCTLRLWNSGMPQALNPEIERILGELTGQNTAHLPEDMLHNRRLAPRIYIQKDEHFYWPGDENNDCPDDTQYCYQQVRPGRQGELRLDGRRCTARIHRRQGAAGCGGHPQISWARTERGPIEPLSVLNRKQTETLKYLE